MTEVLFYHLERRPVEAVLPTMLERVLERGQRAVVQVGSQERLEALDSHLWTYSDDGFLPHGTARDEADAEQPVFLTTGPENPNGAAVRFLVDRAAAPELSGYARAALLFDGNDPEALAAARGFWKEAKAAGHEVTYWQETARGGFERKG
jgi:DNA polymerase-3 subunit chi